MPEPERERTGGFQKGMRVEITKNQRNPFASPNDFLYRVGTIGIVEDVSKLTVFVRTDEGQLIPVVRPDHLKQI